MSSSSSNSKSFPQFKLLTFNCLVQRYTFGDKYPNTNPEDLQWPKRFARFVDIISKSNPDVVCLQEIDDTLFVSDWQPFFAANGYEAHYQKKPKWGNVTAFKSDKFTLEWIDHRSRVLLCLLRLSANAHPIYVANVHLSAEATKAEERVNQVKSVFKQIEKHQQDPKLTLDNSSIVVCGDFNSFPQSGLYKLFTEGKLSADYRDANSDMAYTQANLRLPTCLISAYCAHFKSEPTWTYSYQDRWTDTLDYVFYSPQCMEVVHVDEIETAKVGKNIPNALMPSDHVPMVVELKVRVSAIRRPMNPSA